MVPLKVVTGYVPIPKHPRTAAEYGALGENFRDVAAPVHPFYAKVEDCWLAQYLAAQPKPVTHSQGDNPEKNSLAYHIVQHQKFCWLVMAGVLDRRAETLVWMDYGIFHVPGVTAPVINAFLERVQRDDLAIPGCWPKDPTRTDASPDWRFCGGLMVVPRRDLMPLFTAVKLAVKAHIAFTNNVTWEVNTLAKVERAGVVKPRWYQADHNETMFTGYGAPNESPEPQQPVSS